MNIYNRLYYDICEVLYPGIRCINFNQDSGIASIYTKNYAASFHFTYQEESKITKQLNMVSFRNGTGDNLFDFLEKVKEKDLLVPIHDNGLVERDISKCLFDVMKIEISDSVIDNTCMEVIKRYFPHLKEIEFNHCQIDSSCSFKNIKADLYFEDSEIENMRSFQGCEAELSFLRVKVNKISPTIISSRKITIRSICKQQDINAYELFLKCHFEELKQLEIGNQDISDSFENGFFYLPFSAPKLEEVSIVGKVKDLNFLTKFKYLREISVRAIEDELGLGTAVVTDYNERRKIKERNEKAYQIRKILDLNAEDCYLIGELETERILKLCHFLSFLNTQKEELSTTILEEQNPYQLSKKVDSVVKSYYEYEDGILYSKKAPNDLEVLFGKKPQYRLLNNFLYEYQRDQKKIVMAKDFIYRQDGTPIIFHHRKRQIHTPEEAIRFMFGRTTSKDDSKSYYYNRFLDYLREYPEEDMPIECFIDKVQEEFQIDITEDTFKGLEGATEINKAIFQYNRFRRIKREIKAKQKCYKESLENLIEKNYSLFNFQEKIYLYIHREDSVIEANVAASSKEKEKFERWLEDEEGILESINQKTNGLYSKYQQYMRLTEKSYHTKMQDIEVKKSYVKKIKC